VGARRWAGLKAPRPQQKTNAKKVGAQRKKKAKTRLSLLSTLQRQKNEKHTPSLPALSFSLSFSQQTARKKQEKQEENKKKNDSLSTSTPLRRPGFSRATLL